MSAVTQLDPYGVKWMGAIPSAWTIMPTKRHFDIQLGKMLQNDPGSDTDRLVPYFKAVHVHWGSVNAHDLPEMWANSTEIKQYKVASGDLLVCEGGEVGRAGMVTSSPEDCIIQNALHRIRAKNSGDARFLLYALHAVKSAGWFDVLCNRATIAHFTAEKFADLRIPFPNIDEQQSIAAFLDRETARIDGLIAKKQRQIELLQEKRTALISHAVTKGLNPHAQMKDSGIDWLGEIPRKWELLRLKNAFWLQRGHDLPATEFRDGAYPVIGSNGCIGYHAAFTAKAPGVTVGRSGSIGEIHYIDRNFWAHNTALYVKEFRRASPKYVFYLLKAIDVKYLGEGSAVGTLNRNNIHNLPIALPSAPDQQVITDFLDSKTGHIDALVDKILISTDKLLEYRTALVSAAVTGKIDVRDEGMA